MPLLKLKTRKEHNKKLKNGGPTHPVVPSALVFASGCPSPPSPEPPPRPPMPTARALPRPLPSAATALRGPAAAPQGARHSAAARARCCPAAAVQRCPQHLCGRGGKGGLGRIKALLTSGWEEAGAWPAFPWKEEGWWEGKDSCTRTQAPAHRWPFHTRACPE